MLSIISIIAYSSLFFAIITAILAGMGKYWLYWLSALGINIFSFLAGFSIGQLTVGLTFVFLTLAIAYSTRMIKGRKSGALAVGIGLLIGIIMVLFVDDQWLFFPFLFLA